MTTLWKKVVQKDELWSSGLCGLEKSCSTTSRIAPRTASAGPGNALSGTTSYHGVDGGGLTRTHGRRGVVGLGRGCGKDAAEAAVLGLAARCVRGLAAAAGAEGGGG